MSSPIAESPELAKTTGKCRLCLDSSVRLVDSIENPKLSYRMEKVFFFPIERVEQLPKGVCKSCAPMIHGFYLFAKKIRANQDQLVSQLTINPEEPIASMLPQPSAENAIAEQDDLGPGLDLEPDLSLNLGIDMGFYLNLDLDAEKLDAEKLDAEELDAEELDAEELDAEELDAEKLDAEELDAEKLEAEELDDPSVKHTQTKRKTPKKRKTVSSDAEKEEPKPKGPTSNFELKSEEDKRLAEFFSMVCNLCGTGFDSFTALNSHFGMNHNRSGYVTCCNKKLFKRNHMVDHMKLHADPSAYRCEICNRNFKDKKSLVNHLTKRHGREEDRPYKCNHCKQSFAKKHHLRTHMADHKKAQCPKCPRTLANQRTLRNHLTKVHAEKLVVCPSCEEAFPNRACLRLHLNKEHMQHMLHSMYECHICQKRFKHKKRLEQHIRRSHNETTPHVCDICQQKFSNIQALQNHKRNVHVERKFECKDCGKRFKRAVVLREHQSLHTGEIRHTCRFCGVPMLTKSRLCRHLKKHHSKENIKKKKGTAENAPPKD